MPTWVVRLADDYCDGHYKNAHRPWQLGKVSYRSAWPLSLACKRTQQRTHHSNCDKDGTSRPLLTKTQHHHVFLKNCCITAVSTPANCLLDVGSEQFESNT